GRLEGGAVAVAAALGASDERDPGAGATLPIDGRFPPPLPSGAVSGGEVTTNTAATAAAAPASARLAPTMAPRRIGGRSPVFCGEAIQARRAGVRLTRSAARLASGAEA